MLLRRGGNRIEQTQRNRVRGMEYRELQLGAKVETEVDMDTWRVDDKGIEDVNLVFVG